MQEDSFLWAERHTHGHLTNNARGMSEVQGVVVTVGEVRDAACECVAGCGTPVEHGGVYLEPSVQRADEAHVVAHRALDVVHGVVQLLDVAGNLRGAAIASQHGLHVRRYRVVGEVSRSGVIEERLERHITRPCFSRSLDDQRLSARGAVSDELPERLMSDDKPADLVHSGVIVEDRVFLESPQEVSGVGHILPLPILHDQNIHVLRSGVTLLKGVSWVGRCHDDLSRHLRRISIVEGAVLADHLDGGLIDAMEVAMQEPFGALGIPSNLVGTMQEVALAVIEGYSEVSTNEAASLERLHQIGGVSPHFHGGIPNRLRRKLGQEDALE